MRKIPVFVSCPSTLSDEQKLKKSVLDSILIDLQLEARALGKGEYPTMFPLKEVYVIAKHCAGGVILGFEQIFVEKGIRKRNTNDVKEIKSIDDSISIPTPWNHLEAGILFGLKLPLLIFKEEKVEGGVFDIGNTDVFVHTMPPISPDKDKQDELKQVFLKWFALVSDKYNKY